MKLTSQVIKNKEFKKGVRGYTQEEVDDFLEMVAADYDSIYKEMSQLNEKVAAMGESIAHYLKIEDALQATLVLAQDAAVQLKEKAKAESDRIIGEANEAVLAAKEEAEQILEAANAEAERINSKAKKSAEAAQEEAAGTINEAEELLKKANFETESIIREAKVSAGQILDKAEKNVLFVKDEFEATKREYSDFREKFKEFMKSQMDTFDDVDQEFIKHYEELKHVPVQAEERIFF